MLKIKNLSKFYKIGKEKTPVLKGLNLEIKQGYFVALLGPSGCGKSTLLNILGGLDTFDEGEVIINNENVSLYQKKKQEDKLESFRLRNIGTIFQSFNLIYHMNAIENVEVPLKLAGIPKEERINKAKELLRLVGLEDRMNYKPNQLSGGQKQRVAIARALALEPKVILADEPTGALDTKTGQQILDLLKKISKEKGATVIMVTHAPEVANEADHIIRMVDGEIVSDELTEKEVEIVKPKDKDFKQMNMTSAIKHAYKNVLQKKWRNLLVSVGGSIGIAGIALIVGLGMGIEDKVKEIVGEFMEEDAMMVYQDPEFSKPLTFEQSEELKEIKGVKSVVNYYTFLASDGKDKDFVGKTVSTLSESQTKSSFMQEMITEGKFPINENEIVLDENLAKSFLKDGEELKDILNKEITVYLKGAELKPKVDIKNPFNFTNEKSEEKLIVTGFTMAGESYILNTASEKIAKNIYKDKSPVPMSTFVVATDIKSVNKIQSNIESKGLYSQSNEDILKDISKYSLMIQVALGAFAGISLIVSSIMIGIVLYISVIERVKEIGILRAIGARRKDIRRIFLTEAAIIGFLSSVIGLAFSGAGVLIGNIILSKFLKEDAFNAFTLPISLITFCILFSIVLSLIAGIIPAFKASRLNPVDALRHE